MLPSEPAMPAFPPRSPPLPAAQSSCTLSSWQTCPPPSLSSGPLGPQLLMGSTERGPRRGLSGEGGAAVTHWQSHCPDRPRPILPASHVSRLWSSRQIMCPTLSSAWPWASTQPTLPSIGVHWRHWTQLYGNLQPTRRVAKSRFLEA